MNLTGSQQLLVSGGSSTGQKTQAEILREAAISMGVNKGNITIIPEPLNTREEALHAARIFSSDQPFILVTDAIHMPRAMQQFQKQGLKPIPAPCNFMVKKADVNPPLWWFPSSKNIEKAESTIHEYVGMLWYKLGGG
ncbi:MAG: ElyC/SanA/YdcF family protein [Bacteroidales bacterium]|nr:ElyC/SanA/YdcF family protein [Bacteroidales bacterium]